MTEADLTTHGGARDGAGRPPSGLISALIRLRFESDEEYSQIIDQTEPRDRALAIIGAPVGFRWSNDEANVPTSARLVRMQFRDEAERVKLLEDSTPRGRTLAILGWIAKVARDAS